jgi:hypothetical protein
VRAAVEYDLNFSDTLALLIQRLSAVGALIGNAQGPVAITPPGPGRVDAFMTAHNSVFRKEPAVPMTSPVDYPRIWNIGEMKWLHWDGNTTALTERTVGQALGLGAVVDTDTFVSTVRIENVRQLESLARQITKPAWPFGVDEGLRAAGEAIYNGKGHCADCHSDPSGGHLQDAAGTDWNRAQSFTMHMALDGSFDGAPFYEAWRSTLYAVAQKAYDYADASAADRDSGPEIWRAPGAYVQPSLEGVWASAPFLHNGSVRTLEDLLTDPAARPQGYAAGARDFDTSRVGYVSGGGFAYDASASGNAATGHSYGTTTLTADEKRQLIEYLKTL